MKITLQQIFDLAWKEFIENGGPPSTDGINCLYLSPDGHKCAVGLAIPDGHPAQKSKLSFDGLVNDYPELFDESIINMCSTNLYMFQQALHDAYVQDGKWECGLEYRRRHYIELAGKYLLKVPQ